MNTQTTPTRGTQPAHDRADTLPSPAPASRTRRLLAAWREMLLLVAPERRFGVGVAVAPEALADRIIAQTPLGVLVVYRLNPEAANGITTRDGLILRLYTLAVYQVSLEHNTTAAALFAVTADAVAAAFPRLKRVALRRYPLP